MKAKDYKVGDVPGKICLHSKAYIIEFGLKKSGENKRWSKCIKCHKFTEEELQTLKNQPQYYSSDFISLIKETK